MVVQAFIFFAFECVFLRSVSKAVNHTFKAEAFHFLDLPAVIFAVLVRFST